MRFVQRVLWLLGILLVGWFVWTNAEAYLFQITQKEQLDSRLTDMSTPQVKRSTILNTWTSPGMPIGRIEIPRVKVSAVIEEGDDGPTLRNAVGHIPGTALPGEGGNIGLAAHRDSFFRGLAHVREGDEIVLTTTHGTFRYTIESTGVVSPEQTKVLKAVGVPALTLVTCYPFHFIGPAPDRYVVTAFQKSFMTDNRPRESHQFRLTSQPANTEQ
jgi:LPXTG-site transpeptidase (sortase) family protein